MPRIIGSPVTWLVVWLIIATAYELRGQGSSHNRLLEIALAYIAACWVGRDSSRRKKHFPPDLAFFLAGLIFPLYLLRTRKWQGLLIVVGLAAALMLPNLIAFAWQRPR